MRSPSGNAACPAGKPPPGMPDPGHKQSPAHLRRRRRWPLAAALFLVATAGDQAAARISSTQALFTSQAPIQVNTVTAGPLSCSRWVGEPHTDRSAICTLVVTNNGPVNVPLTVDIATHSTSMNDQPILYYDGPPTLDPPPEVPHYQENLYITESALGAHLGFGALDCATGHQTPGTCASTASSQPVTSLDPGQSDTFTVTVELDKGADNGGTLVVDLTAHAGPATTTLIDITSLS